jgi:hypothetical protein
MFLPLSSQTWLLGLQCICTIVGLYITRHVPFLLYCTYTAVCSHLLTLVPLSRISYTLKMEARRSSETSVNKISTGLHIQEDGILHSYRHGNLKSYIFNFTNFSCYYVIILRIFMWSEMQSPYGTTNRTNKNSVSWVRKRNIPIDWATAACRRS